MGKRLWKVTVEVPMIVLAEGTLTAKMTALDNFRDEVRNADVREYNVFVRSSPLSATERLPVPWGAECIPWGAEGERTIRQILSEGTER